MEFVFEIILQILGELFLQVFFELLAEYGLNSLAAPFRRPRHPAFSIVGYMIWGAIAGGISLWLFPASIIRDPIVRMMNLILTPVCLGFLMMRIGKIRLKNGREIVRLDQFGFAFLFAFAMAVVRFIWAA